jgi:A/G-specific adenine glycosylase
MKLNSGLVDGVRALQSSTMGKAKPQIRSLNVSRFRTLLLRWFARHQRKLPWRGQTDPYRILVSEIMLQQTRVAVVEDRYKKFLRQFPTAGVLARARRQTVLAAWSGLGYYRRARSLHAAAKQVLRQGRFPRTSAELRALPGVGHYTGNAVASMAFAEPVPVVDGNVQRVLRRLFGHPLSLERCWRATGELLDARRPGDFNQAMMELGAMVCLPGTPLCARCPVAALCASRGAGPKPEQTPRRKSVLNYVLVRRNGSVLLRQRPASCSLMPGMWELPSVQPASAKREPIIRLRHSITTTDYRVSVFPGNANRSADPQARWVTLRAAEKLPLTGLARKILCWVRSNSS